MIFKFVLALPLVSLLLMDNAKASTYDLSLTSSIGPSNGSGSFTVNGSIAGTGLTTFTEAGGLTSLNFAIDGYNFSLNSDLGKASVTFNNGALTNVAYLGAIGGFKLDLGTLGLGYIFTDSINPGLSSIGTISASSGVSATPLPPSWTLMLIGLAGFGFVAYRRQKKHGAFASA
jgi:hypothetical protein